MGSERRVASSCNKATFKIKVFENQILLPLKVEK